MSPIIRFLAATALFVLLYLMLSVAWLWDIRTIIHHFMQGTFLNPFFIIFVLGPPTLIAIAVDILIAPEIRRLALRAKAAHSRHG